MKLAWEMRLPRSIVMGRGWPKPGEPLFLEDDVELFLAWQAELADTCSGCGQSLRESTDPDYAGAYVGHAVVCYGCAARSRAEAKRRGSGKSPARMHGVRFYVERLPEVTEEDDS